MCIPTGGGGLPNKETWTVCWFNGGLAKNKDEGVYTPPMHTISSQNSLKVTTNYYEKKYLLVISKNKKHSSKQVVPITHIGEKGLCCCNFSRFVGGFFSDKVKNCVVKFAFFEPSISRGQ